MSTSDFGDGTQRLVSFVVGRVILLTPAWEKLQYCDAWLEFTTI